MKWRFGHCCYGHIPKNVPKYNPNESLALKNGAIHTVAIDTDPLKRANNPNTSESLALNKMAQYTEL